MIKKVKITECYANICIKYLYILTSTRRESPVKVDLHGCLLARGHFNGGGSQSINEYDRNIRRQMSQNTKIYSEMFGNESG